jgi:hypothetical protein
MGLLDKIKDLGKGYIESDETADPEEDLPPAETTAAPTIASKPNFVSPANRTLGLNQQKTATAAPTISLAKPAGQFVQAKYDVLQQEVLGRHPFAAAFLTEYNSPMAKRIKVESDRFQAAAETVAAEKNCTVAEVLNDIKSAVQTVGQEINEYHSYKEGDKATRMLPLQGTLTKAQSAIAAFRDDINSVQTQLETDIQNLRNTASERVGQITEQIRQKELGMESTNADLTKVEQEFNGDIADFDVSSDRLKTELTQVLTSAQQYLR